MPKANPDQFEVTWLFPHCKEVVRPDEVAVALNMSPRQVLEHCESGNFLDAPIGDAPAAEQKRVHRRIMRFSVEAWWLNHIADKGLSMPIKESPQVAWWREQLRQKNHKP